MHPVHNFLIYFPTIRYILFTYVLPLLPSCLFPSDLQTKNVNAFLNSNMYTLMLFYHLFLHLLSDCFSRGFLRYVYILIYTMVGISSWWFVTTP